MTISMLHHVRCTYTAPDIAGETGPIAHVAALDKNTLGRVKLDQKFLNFCARQACAPLKFKNNLELYNVMALNFRSDCRAVCLNSPNQKCIPVNLATRFPI